MPNADLKKYLPRRLVEVIGQNMPAIINSFNQGADEVEKTIQACIDQLFITTASGKYLLNLGEEGGFAIPPSAGLDVRAFRVLVPIMVSNPKQVRISINDLVQAFYGSERTRANITSTVFGPYSIDSNDDLLIETDAGSFSVNVLANQVSSLASVSATELSSIINYSQSLVLAEAILDRTTGLEALRLTSKTAGTGSYVRVVGGKLQNILKFPKLAATNIIAGQVFNITKPSLLSDEVTITWNGTGTNPLFYTANVNDVMTIKGLSDVGPTLFSNLNGSYTLIDAGYDYVKIRNTQFPHISETLTLPADNSFVITLSDKTTIFDKSEYAFTSETEDQTITVTVPAVPPLTLRFLGGSAHLQGSVLEVLDFTRTSVQVSLPIGVDPPEADNLFILSNTYQRLDFAAKKYKTFFSDEDPNAPIYQLESADSEHAIFPYTAPTNIGTNSIYCTIDSPVIRVTFPFQHGLQKSWGFNLSTTSQGGNYTATNLNKEHAVKNVQNEMAVYTTIKNPDGSPKPFEGFPFGPVDVYRQSVAQADGADCYLDFVSSAALLAAGFSVGDLFKFDPLLGTDINPFFANTLKFKKLSVTSITNTGAIHRVYFNAGIGIGGTGMIIQSAEGFKSGSLGGTVTYYTDKTSAYNQQIIFSDLRANFLNAVRSQNPAYVGSFVYDPQGAKTNVTVSQYVAGLSENVLKGEALPTIQVDSLDANGAFPTAGKLVIGYGTNRYEGPISYFATISNTGNNQIVIDPAYKFKFSHPVGDKVQFIHDTQPFTPDKFGAAYPVYITGTSQARETMFALIKSLVAAGIFIEKEVIFPDLRYDDISIVPFE